MIYASLNSVELFHNFWHFYPSCFPQGEYEQGVKDCDQALNVCKESRRALYRKALCLKELGKHREAYSCTTDCLLIYRLVKDAVNVNINTVRIFKICLEHCNLILHTPIKSKYF